MSTDDDPTGPAQTGLGVRLAVIKDIAQAMRDPQPPDRIIQAAVDSLHVHFPHLRSAYSTVARDGRIRVESSAGSAWPESAGELVLPGGVMETLRSRDLIVIEDTATGIASGALLTGLVSANVRALLDAPVIFSETLVGLLSLDATTPRQWSDHERATLREAADFLRSRCAMPMRDASSRTVSGSSGCWPRAATR